MASNYWSDVSSISNSIREDAVFAMREMGVVSRLVRVFTDATGGNPRIGYQYSTTAAGTVAENAELTSDSITPAALATLTPVEIGKMYRVSDLRAESDAPENIVRDAAIDLGAAAAEYVENALISTFASLTGGTVGATGGTITWGHVAAAIYQARYLVKSSTYPLYAVIHGNQAAILAKSASIAGATSIAQAPNVSDEITRIGLRDGFLFMGVPVYVSYKTLTGTDFIGAVFARDAIALDWRRPVRIRAERNEAARATDFVMSAVVATGVWRPALGVQMVFGAPLPTS